MTIYNILYNKPHNPHYLKRYIKFISNLKDQTIRDSYSEKHHIAPKSMFPELRNDKNNLVRITARQHFVAHWLLWKAYSTLEMARAFHLMHLDKRNSRSYSAVRHTISESMKGNRNFGSCAGKENGFYGKKHTEEHKNELQKELKLNMLQVKR